MHLIFFRFYFFNRSFGVRSSASRFLEKLQSAQKMNETVAILAEEEVLLISAFHAGQTESNAVEEVVHRRQFVTLYDWTDAIVCEIGRAHV